MCSKEKIFHGLKVDVSAFQFCRKMLNPFLKGQLIALSVICITSPVQLLGQTGPGGVGNSTSNIIWLKADQGTYSDAGVTPSTNGAGVQQWNDQSGNTNNATQTTVGNQPTYTTGALNGRPVLRFDGINDWMGITINVPETDFSQFMVFRTIGGDGDGAGIAITDPTSPTAGSHDRQFGLNGNKLRHRLWNNQIIASAADFNDNNAHIANIIVNSASGQTIYANGTSVATGSKTSSDFNWQTGMVIGGHNFWGYLNADIPEIIFYNIVLNAAQRIIVDNYLAAKYGLSIANDYFTYEFTHSYDVAGIGRETAAATHTSAMSANILQVSNPSGLDADQEYLNSGMITGMLLLPGRPQKHQMEVSLCSALLVNGDLVNKTEM